MNNNKEQELKDLKKIKENLESEQKKLQKQTEKLQNNKIENVLDINSERLNIFENQPFIKNITDKKLKRNIMSLFFFKEQYSNSLNNERKITKELEDIERNKNKIFEKISNLEKDSNNQKNNILKLNNKIDELNEQSKNLKNNIVFKDFYTLTDRNHFIYNTTFMLNDLAKIKENKKYLQGFLKSYLSMERFIEEKNKIEKKYLNKNDIDDLKEKEKEIINIKEINDSEVTSHLFNLEEFIDNTYLSFNEMINNSQKNINKTISIKNIKNESEEISLIGTDNKTLKKLFKNIGELQDNIINKPKSKILFSKFNDVILPDIKDLDIKNIPKNHIYFYYKKILKETLDKVPHYQLSDITDFVLKSKISPYKEYTNDNIKIKNKNEQEKIYCLVYQNEIADRKSDTNNQFIRDGERRTFIGTKAEILEFQKKQINDDGEIIKQEIKSINLESKIEQEKLFNTIENDKDFFEDNNVILPIFQGNIYDNNINNKKSYKEFLEQTTREEMLILESYKNNFNGKINPISLTTEKIIKENLIKLENFIDKNNNKLNKNKIILDDKENENKTHNFIFKNEIGTYDSSNERRDIIREKKLKLGDSITNLKNGIKENDLKELSITINDLTNNIEKEIQGENDKDNKAIEILENFSKEAEKITKKDNKGGIEFNLKNFLNQNKKNDITDLTKKEFIDNISTDQINELLISNTYEKIQLISSKIELQRAQLEAMKPDFQSAFSNPILLIITGGLIAFKGEFNKMTNLYFAAEKDQEIRKNAASKKKQLLNKIKEHIRKSLDKMGLDPDLVNLMEFDIIDDELKIYIQDPKTFSKQIKKTINENKDIYDPNEESLSDYEKLKKELNDKEKIINEEKISKINNFLDTNFELNELNDENLEELQKITLNTFEKYKNKKNESINNKGKIPYFYDIYLKELKDSKLPYNIQKEIKFKILEKGKLKNLDDFKNYYEEIEKSSLSDKDKIKLLHNETISNKTNKNLFKKGKRLKPTYSSIKNIYFDYIGNNDKLKELILKYMDIQNHTNDKNIDSYNKDTIDLIKFDIYCDNNNIKQTNNNSRGFETIEKIFNEKFLNKNISDKDFNENYKKISIFKDEKGLNRLTAEEFKKEIENGNLKNLFFENYSEEKCNQFKDKENKDFFSNNTKHQQFKKIKDLNVINFLNTFKETFYQTNLKGNNDENSLKLELIKKIEKIDDNVKTQKLGDNRELFNINAKENMEENFKPLIKSLNSFEKITNAFKIAKKDFQKLINKIKIFDDLKNGVKKQPPINNDGNQDNTNNANKQPPIDSYGENHYPEDNTNNANEQPTIIDNGENHYPEDNTNNANEQPTIIDNDKNYYPEDNINNFDEQPLIDSYDENHYPEYNINNSDEQLSIIDNDKIKQEAIKAAKERKLNKKSKDDGRSV